MPEEKGKKGIERKKCVMSLRSKWLGLSYRQNMPEEKEKKGIERKKCVMPHRSGLSNRQSIPGKKKGK